MYLEFFGLEQPPFRITPNTGLFYGGGNRGAILDALAYAVTSGEGIVKVSGEVGSGKTMLCRMLELRLPDNIDIVYLANPSLSREEILPVIAAELKVAAGDDNSLLRALQDYLIARHEEGRQVVVFVEEAQAMPLETLEEIRLLSNLETAHHKLLQVVLFGQPELDQHLDLPRMRQLKERITHSFRLAPFGHAEIQDYLNHRLRAAGYRGPDLFGPATVKPIARASRGITRRINILADKTLLAAYAANTHTLQPAHVKAAIADSEFGRLPADRPQATASPRLALLTLLLGIALGSASWFWLGERATALPRGATAAPAPVAIAAPQPAATPSAPSAATPVAAMPAAGAAPAEPARQAPAALSAPLTALRAWLDDTAGPAYTIQLNRIEGSRAAELTASYLGGIAGQLPDARLLAYPLDGDAAKGYGVLLGTYASASAARQAIAGLPASLRSFRPMVRSRTGISDEMLTQKQ